MRTDGPRLRLSVLGVVAVSLFAALFARLWYLQVLASPEYQLQASALQRRVVIEPAPRGRILDRRGEVLVDNRLSYVVSLDRQRLADLDTAAQDELLTRLVGELAAADPTVTLEIVRERMGSNRYSPYTPVPVADDVPEELAVRLSEREAEFGHVVEVDARAVRTYPYGRLASHVVGYVGPINDEEFAREQRRRPGRYQLTDEIGKTGVEATFESALRGTPGRTVYEVNADGDPVRILQQEAPIAGNDVVLSIDLRVQAIAEQALREELARSRERRVTRGNPPNTSPAGAVVVEDVVEGSILAMASFPDFDPRALGDGIDQNEWLALTVEGSFDPLTNRAISGQYAPGSTFKLITAYGALASGLITPERAWHDEGVYTVPNCRGESCRFRNAGSQRYGNVDLREALTVSSDTYFYDIGARAWFERGVVGDPIQEAAETFGLGAATGVPLPGERGGRIMTPEEFAARNQEQPEVFPDGDWQAGDNVNMSIGQGEVLVTPLQLANAYGALANGGTVHSPNIVLEIRRAGSEEVVRTYEPRVLRTVEFQPGWREAFVDGFVGVTVAERGTAAGSFAGFPNWTVAAKTGTAQVANKADTAVFAAFAPAEAPRYVAAAFMEESGFGGVAAAPLVRRIFEPLALGEPLPGVQEGGEFGYTVALPAQADPFASGDVTD